MLILASSSPRRRELLSTITNNFMVALPDVDENLDIISPGSLVETLAESKASYIYEQDTENVVIGADTVVVYKNEILGKPKDFDDATRMLEMLSNDIHQVYTGVCVVSSKGKDMFYEITDVYFGKMSEEEIHDYVMSGEPMDKAGAYGIQGLAAKFVEQIRGDYSTVVGLPLYPLYNTLKKHMEFL